MAPPIAPVSVGDEVVAVDGVSITELGSSETMLVSTQRPSGATANSQYSARIAPLDGSRCARSALARDGVVARRRLAATHIGDHLRLGSDGYQGRPESP